MISVLIKFFLWTAYPLIYLFGRALSAVHLPFIKRRENFELKNFLPASKSFAEDGLKAHLAFEVSSEGEMQHILPIVEKALSSGLLVEIIYCSGSLEHFVTKFSVRTFAGEVRFLRLPLVTFFPGTFSGLQRARNPRSWLTADCFILVRYDFFPHLIDYGINCASKSFIVLNASLKSKMKSISSNPLSKWWWNRFYSEFDLIVCPSEADSESFTQLGIESKKIDTSDLRSLQIIDRVKASESKLESAPHYQQILAWLEEAPKSKRVILGSFWPMEAALLSDSDFLSKIEAGEIKVFIAPHSLGPESIVDVMAELKKVVSSKSIELCILDGKNQEGVISKNSIVIFPYGGFLCEWYHHFGKAYVGGGHGVSIHSVMEPYWSSCQVFCGPKTHRSTEFDFIKNQNKDYPVVVGELSHFYRQAFNDDLEVTGTLNLDQVEKKSAQMVNQIIVWAGE
ncbi:MAG: hypothetical protein HOE90_11100 [Bacteriovoracaceae bacterium]|jgi:3-deoxy-D-manno-octulosonic-acid transferase|nr:hypothetical protein [Bacteriovoracaceae bacterium]